LLSAAPPSPVIRVEQGDFEVEAEMHRIRDGRHDIGAIVTFTGICRDENGRLAALELEHYPAMAEAEMTRLANQAMQNWPLQALTIIHRHGRIKPGENIVLVIAASSHRQAAFEAASFVMDFLKNNAPFWKKELLADGQTGGWVEAGSADAAAEKRWKHAISGLK
jgi:molybdopterin synthase catalytic subunit